MIRFQTIAGDARSIGSATGRLMGPWVRELVRGYPIYYRKRGQDYAVLKRRALALLPESRRAFPQIIKDLSETARAARVSFEDAWFMAAEEEVTDLIAEGRRAKKGHCTSVMIATRDLLAMVHNEDYDGRYRGMVAVQEIRPRGSVPVIRFLYPAAVPGTTCAANAAGIAFSEDSLNFPTYPRGVCKNVLLAALQSVRSLSEATNLFRRHKPVIGFVVNLISQRERKAISLERTAQGIAVITARTALVHANNALRPYLLGGHEIRGTHARDRVVSVRADLGRAPTLEAAARALAKVPMVRSSYRSPSAHMTIATAGVDFHARQFGIKVWGPRRPKWEWFAIPQ